MSDDNAETHIPAVQSHHPPEEDKYTQEMQNGHEEYDQQQTQDLSGYGILPEHGLCARAVYDYQACKYGVTIIKLYVVCIELQLSTEASSIFCTDL